MHFSVRRSLQECAKQWVAVWLALALAILPIKALAGSMTLLGVGGGSAAATYTGLGDVATAQSFTVQGYWSCSRSYSAAKAATNNQMCEVTRSSDGKTCILQSATTGFVDLVTTYCNTSTQTIVAFCNATTCGIDKKFNQENPGTCDMTQGTAGTFAATMPVLSFSAINGLPAEQYTAGSSQLSASTGCLTAATTPSTAVVFKRTVVASGGYLDVVGTQNLDMRGGSSANQAVVGGGGNVTVTATDNSWNGLIAYFSGVSNTGAFNINGSDNTNQVMGTSGVTANAVARNGESLVSTFTTGLIAESFITTATAASSATQRGAIYTNWHGASGYNGAF